MNLRFLTFAPTLLSASIVALGGRLEVWEEAHADLWRDDRVLASDQRGHEKNPNGGQE